MNAKFKGEVQTHAQRRFEGVRIKHQMKSNKLKMYDKAGRVLRIETWSNIFMPLRRPIAPKRAAAADA